MQTQGVFITIPKVARCLGVSKPTVREMIRSGRIKGVRLNRRTMVHREELKRFEQQGIARGFTCSESSRQAYSDPQAAVGRRT